MILVVISSRICCIFMVYTILSVWGKEPSDIRGFRFEKRARKARPRSISEIQGQEPGASQSDKETILHIHSPYFHTS